MAGYNVYYGTASHSYMVQVPVGTNVSATVSGLSDATTYYFAVTAVDASGVESDYSAELSDRTPGNRPPTISSIADQTVNTSQSTPVLSFTVNDAETPAGNLFVTAGASDNTLIPDGNIVLGGSGANRTVRVTPAPGLNGVTQVTLTVNDGTNSTSTAFNLTVQSSGSTNTPPTISAIGAQTVTAGHATSAIGFTVGDAQTAASSLTLSGTSSATTLVPNASIVFGGSGANRTVTVTPAAGQTGSALITVIVSDGTYTASTSFNLTVTATATNTPPTISAIGTQTVTSGQSTAAIPFTIGDAETAAASLTLSKTSSSTTLVPTANIVFGGSGANRTVTVTPAAGKTGTAQITVTVSDGTNTASSSFNLMVNAAPTNTPPTIAPIGNQIVTVGQPTAAIPFAIGDVETPAANLTVSGTSSSTTLVPTANIVFGGSGANRTVTVTPVAGKTGTAQITVKVSDGTNSASSVFTLTVLSAPTNTPPTISSIPNQTVTVGQSTAALPFTINDNETPAANLALGAVSTDTTLVPNANIVLGGSDQNRTVTVTPAPGLTGTAQIKISVSDGTNTVIASFTLTVLPVPTNTPPTISAISDQTGYVNQAVGPVAFSISDSQTPAASLILSVVSSNETVIPTASIVLGGSGGNRTVSLTPVADQTGSSIITITVSDGTNTAQSSFNVTIVQPTVMTRSSLPATSTYNGLFYESDAVRTRSAGSFKLTVTSLGKYSGTLQMAGGKYTFTGQFGTLCMGTNTVLRKGTTPLILNFSLNPDGSPSPFSGNLSDGTWTAGMLGKPAPFNIKTHPAPYIGTYTIAVPNQDFGASVPLGSGYGSVKVDGNGNAKFSGVLADGTKITQSAQLSADGTWPLFVPLYSGKGLLMAWISFANRTDDDLHGDLNWIKTADPLAKYYPGGFALEGSAVGALFPVQSALVLNAQVAKLQSQGNGNSVVSSITVSASTGTFKGSLLDKSTGKPSAFQGALLLKTETGYGFILGTGESTPFLLAQ